MHAYVYSVYYTHIHQQTHTYMCACMQHTLQHANPQYTCTYTGTQTNIHTHIIYVYMQGHNPLFLKVDYSSTCKSAPSQRCFHSGLHCSIPQQSCQHHMLLNILFTQLKTFTKFLIAPFTLPRQQCRTVFTVDGHCEMMINWSE